MWNYNYTTEQYLEHDGVKGMRWGYSHGKSNGNRKAKDNEVPDVSPDMERVAYGLGGEKYQKDKQDLEYERNHAAGKDKRTYDEYMNDKIKVYKSSNNKKDEKKAAKSKSNISQAELKKERRKDLINAGKSFMSYYF